MVTQPVGDTNPTFHLLIPDSPFQLLIPLRLSCELDTLTSGGWVASSSRLRKNYVGTPER
jgi:hypothetical protein